MRQLTFAKSFILCVGSNVPRTNAAKSTPEFSCFVMNGCKRSCQHNVFSYYFTKQQHLLTSNHACSENWTQIAPSQSLQKTKMDYLISCWPGIRVLLQARLYEGAKFRRKVATGWRWWWVIQNLYPLKINRIKLGQYISTTDACTCKYIN